MMYYTYLWTDPRTNIPFYVGKGHGGRAWSMTQRNKQVQGRLNKLKVLGLEPIVETVETLTENDALWFEKDLIASLGRKDKRNGSLLNHTDGGEGNNFWKGKKRSLEAKKNMSLARVGIKLSDETKKRLSQSMRGNTHLRGKTLSEETRKKMSISSQNRWKNTHVCE